MAMTKNNANDRERQNEMNKSELSDVYDLEQVTLKLQLHADHCLVTWLRIWYHSLLRRDHIRKVHRLSKAKLLIRCPPRIYEEISKDVKTGTVNDSALFSELTRTYC